MEGGAWDQVGDYNKCMGTNREQHWYISSRTSTLYNCRGLGLRAKGLRPLPYMNLTWRLRVTELIAGIPGALCGLVINKAATSMPTKSV